LQANIVASDEGLLEEVSEAVALLGGFLEVLAEDADPFFGVLF